MIKVRILVVFASIFAFLAIFTSWVDRQALDTDEYVETSGKMLEDEVISAAIADYAVDELFTNVDVAELLEEKGVLTAAEFKAEKAKLLKQ